MVQPSKCSSYRGFELSSDFYEKVLFKVQREFKNNLSYWKFELSGVQVVGSVLYFIIKNEIQNSINIQSSSRLVFSWFFDIRGNLGNVKDFYLSSRSLTEEIRLF